jgi:hypothetical protein
MARWLVIAVLLWLALLSVLTLIAIFRHSSSHHTGSEDTARPGVIALR